MIFSYIAINHGILIFLLLVYEKNINLNHDSWYILPHFIYILIFESKN